MRTTGCAVGVGVSPRGLARSRNWSLSFEGDSDSGPYLFYLNLSVILLQCIWLLCNLFYNWNSVHYCAPFIRRI